MCLPPFAVPHLSDPTMIDAPAQERRLFKMHPRLLLDVIQRQAGSLGKAVLEAVMNAVDAKASRVDISVTTAGVVITDDGKGFRNAEEIEKFFETFGQPHEEAEEKVYAAFRMGRGQLFAYGRNQWRTGPYAMDVDVKLMGAAYDLQEGLPHAPGCKIGIDLYDNLRMLPSQLDRCLADVEKYVKYVTIPVVLNGRQVSRDPTSERWDVETEDYFIRFRTTGPVDVYNLGVWVRDYDSSRFATGGTVVAKQKLVVNFARNDVMDECPIWRRLQRDLDQRARDRVARRSERMTEEQREYVIAQVRAGTHVDNLRSLRIFGDVRRVHWSIDMLDRHVRKHHITQLAAAQLYDGRGDKLMQLNSAVVLSSVTLERFRVGSVLELVTLLQARGLWDGGLASVTPVALEIAAAELSAVNHIVPEAQWKPWERLVIEFLSRGAIMSTLCPDHRASRVLKIGESDIYAGWTDGSTYIALERQQLRGLTTLAQWYRLGHILIHEYCHDDSTENTHVHGAEFFENHHNFTRERIGPFLESVMRDWPDAIRRDGRTLRGRIARMRDEIARIEREAENRVAVEEEHERVSAQLALFDAPRVAAHRPANRRAA